MSDLDQGIPKFSPSDFVSSIHKIIDERLRKVLPYMGRVATANSLGVSVTRTGDDTSGLESPQIAPGDYAVNDRVLVLPTPNGFDVVLGKVNILPEMRYFYTLGPWTRENITGIANFTTRVHMPSAASTFGSLAIPMPVPVDGKAVGGVIMASEARTGGEAHLGIDINGVDNEFSSIRIGSSPNQYDSNIVPYSSGFTVHRGDLVRAKIMSNNWAPATADFAAYLFLVGVVPG
jgi:hypothetical protein